MKVMHIGGDLIRIVGWMCINHNSHWMRFWSIHFHRQFEAGLKANYIITGINAVLYIRVWLIV